MAQSFAGPLAGFPSGDEPTGTEPGGTRTTSRASLPAVSAPAAALFALLRTWRRRADEKAQLARLDARELRDAGLTDADRAAILNTPLWREAAPRR